MDAMECVSDLSGWASVKGIRGRCVWLVEKGENICADESCGTGNGWLTNRMLRLCFDGSSPVERASAERWEDVGGRVEVCRSYMYAV